VINNDNEIVKYKYVFNTYRSQVGFLSLIDVILAVIDEIINKDKESFFLSVSIIFRLFLMNQWSSDVHKMNEKKVT
jgi:hypothetical protein